MRKLRDEKGNRWDVVLGHASWGVFQALFVPASAQGEGGRAYAVTLSEASRAEAARALQRMDRAELLRLLTVAQPVSGPE